MYSAGFIWKCLRALVATVFVASGILKLADIQAFRNSLESLSVAPPFFLPALAVLLPLVELTFGVALILHFKAAVASECLLHLSAVFLVIVTGKFLEGAKTPCGCFSTLDASPISGFTVTRNVLLVILTASVNMHEWRVNFGIPLNARSPLSPRVMKSWLVFRLWFRRGGSRALGIALLAVMYTLALQNSVLKNRLSFLTAQLSELQNGTIVRSFSGLTKEGVRLDVEYDGFARTILCVQKVGCDLCKQNLRYWHSLATSLQPRGVRFLSVVLDTALTQHAGGSDPEDTIDFPSIVVDERAFARDFKILTTPHTILLAQDTVIRVWRGLLGESTVRSIVEACFIPITDSLTTKEVQH